MLSSSMMRHFYNAETCSCESRLLRVVGIEFALASMISPSALERRNSCDVKMPCLEFEDMPRNGKGHPHNNATIDVQTLVRAWMG